MGDRLVFAFRHFPLAEMHPFAHRGGAGRGGGRGARAVLADARPALRRRRAAAAAGGPAPVRRGDRRAGAQGRVAGDAVRRGPGGGRLQLRACAAACAGRRRSSSTASSTAATRRSTACSTPWAPATGSDDRAAHRHLQPAARPGRAQQAGRPRRRGRGHRQAGRGRRGGAGGRPRAVALGRAATRSRSWPPGWAGRASSPRRCSATRRCAGSAGPAPIPTRAARRTGSACSAGCPLTAVAIAALPGGGPGEARPRRPDSRRPPILYRDGEPRAALRVTVEAPVGPGGGDDRAPDVRAVAGAAAARRRSAAFARGGPDGDGAAVLLGDLNLPPRVVEPALRRTRLADRCRRGRRSRRGARSPSSTTCSSAAGGDGRAAGRARRGRATTCR